MSGTRVFKRGEMDFVHYGGPPGHAEIARVVGPDVSSSMGGGIATFDGCSIEWTLLYDELVVVLKGLFRLKVGDEVHEAGPGDIVWIPEKTPVRYEGEKAEVFYTLWPVDWKKRHGIE